MKPDLLEQAKQLPIPERIGLVEAIWDSVAEDAPATELSLSEEHRLELDRRLEDARTRPEDEAPWSEVRGQLRRR